VDTLTGPGSELPHLDHKKRNEFFSRGVELGWLIDPENRIMIEYKKNNVSTRSGEVSCLDNHSWGDLSGGDVWLDSVLSH
jgi:hypothetical protein